MAYTKAQIAMVRAQNANIRHAYDEAIGHALRAIVLASRDGDKETLRYAKGMLRFATKRIKLGETKG